MYNAGSYALCLVEGQESKQLANLLRNAQVPTSTRKAGTRTSRRSSYSAALHASRYWLTDSTETTE
jgi:hypothetical protein